jgi:hypothetical protein
MRSRKILVTSILLAITTIAITAMRPPQKKWQNLKVLPKNISTDSLMSIMDQYNASLNVQCSFCHQTGGPSNDYKEDYASDEKQKKQITRTMMQMTALLNKKYFPYRKVPEMVTCYTCHKGKSVPEPTPTAP